MVGNLRRSLLPAGLMATVLCLALSGVASASSGTYGPYSKCVSPAGDGNNQCYNVTYSEQASLAKSGSTYTYTFLFSALIQKGSSGLNFPISGYNTPWGYLGAMHPTMKYEPIGASSWTSRALTSCGQQSQGSGIAVWCTTKISGNLGGGVYNMSVSFDRTAYWGNNFGVSLPNQSLPM
jgi:hypothetical protein